MVCFSFSLFIGLSFRSLLFVVFFPIIYLPQVLVCVKSNIFFYFFLVRFAELEQLKPDQEPRTFTCDTREDETERKKAPVADMYILAERTKRKT